MLPYFLKPKLSVKLKRLGSKNDGGYFVPKKLILATENLICFGLGFNWDFEKDFLKYNKSCKLMIYDHTVTYFSLIIDFFKSLFFSLRYRKEFSKVLKIFDYLRFFRAFRAVHKKIKSEAQISKNSVKLMLKKHLKIKEKFFLKLILKVMSIKFWIK